MRYVAPMLDFIIDALATHRLTRLVIEDDITADLRERVWRRHPPHDDKLGYLLTCPWCTSMWAGFAVAAARTIAPSAWRPLSYALALSSLVGLIEERK